MKTRKILAIGIVALVVCSVGLVIAQDQSKEYVVINAPLSPEEGDDVYSIPPGSIIYHSADGITTVYTPDGKGILTAKDSEASMIPTTTGLKPATKIHQVPSGSFITDEEDFVFYAQDEKCELTGDTTAVYAPDGKCILTVIDAAPPVVPPQALQTYDATYNGWVEQANDWTVSSLHKFYAYWHVPSSPPSPHSNVVDYLFNGIEPSTGGKIIQPVLGYFQNGNKWEAHAEYANSDGFVSDPIACSVGDKLRGAMLWSTSESKWIVEVYNCDDGACTWIKTDKIGVDNLAVFVTYEAFNIANDNDAQGDATFYDMEFKDKNGYTPTITWHEDIDEDAPLTGLNVDIESQSKVTLETAN